MAAIDDFIVFTETQKDNIVSVSRDEIKYKGFMEREPAVDCGNVFCYSFWMTYINRHKINYRKEMCERMLLCQCFKEIYGKHFDDARKDENGILEKL